MNSIRRQLTRLLLWAILLSVGGGLLAVYFAAQAALESEFDRALLTKAHALSSLTWQNADRVVVAQWDRYLHGFDTDVATDFFQMWLENGADQERSASLAKQELPQRFGTVEKPAYFNHTLANGQSVRVVGYVFSPRQTNNFSNFAPIRLRLGVASLRLTLDNTLFILRIGLFSCGVLLTVLMLLIVPRVLEHGLRPLDDLAGKTAFITVKSLGTRFKVDNMPEELRPIASQLNDLLRRLEESFEREEQFSANLAHELRTPLAEMRGLIELGLKWPESRNPATEQELLGVLQHTEGMVNRLLDLAQSDYGQLPIVRKSLHVQPVFASVWRRFAGKSRSRRLKVKFGIPPDLAIEADAVLFRNLVVNLLDNAAEYTPREGDIFVHASQETGNFCLRVCNTVDQSFKREDLPKLFDRFWRQETARTRSHHTGLGLSFVLAVANAHGWTVSADLDANRLLQLQLVGRSDSSQAGSARVPAPGSEVFAPALANAAAPLAADPSSQAAGQDLSTLGETDPQRMTANPT